MAPSHRSELLPCAPPPYYILSSSPSVFVASPMNSSSRSDSHSRSCADLARSPFLYWELLQHVHLSMDANTRIMMSNLKTCLHTLPYYHLDKPKRTARTSGFAKMLCGDTDFANISIYIARKQPLEDVKDSAKQVGKELRIPVPPADVPGIGVVKSLTLKQLICGMIAGGVASFAVSPFEVLRTRVIAGKGGSSTGQVLDRVVKFEGIKSLMKGNFMVSLFATSLEKGVQFATFEAVKRKEEEKVGKDLKWVPSVSRKLPISTVAGAAAGLASTLVVYPLNTVMDHMLLQPNEYPSIWATVRKVIGQKGILELYRGFVPAMISMIPQAGASFYAYETVTRFMNARISESKYSLALTATSAGAGAGLVATTLTYPLELARKKISISALPRGSVGMDGRYNNLSQALMGIVHREGFSGLYRGFPIQALQFIPLTTISFVVYEACKRIFIAEGREHRDEVKG